VFFSQNCNDKEFGRIRQIHSTQVWGARGRWFESSPPDKTGKAFGDSQELFCFEVLQACLHKRKNKKLLTHDSAAKALPVLYTPP
jgi:hypothetical protein